ncbi:hypothetical protein EJV44_15540 [Ancylobacter aquaticus]|nr:hypothetical protein EJV44_15540 [Ancylobacter aquaticus]
MITPRSRTTDKEHTIQTTYAAYVGDGENRLFVVPFEKLSRAYVKVRVNGEQVTFEWLSDAQISLDAAPAAGALIEVYRETGRDPVASFSDGSTITGADLNAVYAHSLHLAQEAVDASSAAVGAVPVATAAMGIAEGANLAAQEADGKADAALQEAQSASAAAASLAEIAEELAEAASVRVAADLPYNNFASGLPATNVQQAVDVIASATGIIPATSDTVRMVGSGETLTEVLTEHEERIDEIEGGVAGLSGTVSGLSSSVSSGLAARLRIDAEAGLTAQQKANGRANLDLNDPWLCQPIGVPVPLWTHLSGVTLPPTDRAYRYVLLTAGNAGAGQYNAGILTGEAVAGSDPTVSASAVISDAASPLNGATIRLINSERRFLRPGTSGALEESANKAHDHGGETGGAGAHRHAYTRPKQQIAQSGGGGGFFAITPEAAETDPAPAHAHPIASEGGPEARPRSIGAAYVMRIR